MRTLSTPTVWDGPEAKRFRATAPRLTAGLAQALQTLQRLESSSEQILDDIVRAGSQGSLAVLTSGGMGGPVCPAVPIAPGVPLPDLRRAWDSFWHWANTPVDAPRYGEIAASAVNVSYGEYKLYVGIPLVIAGTAATVTVPVIGQLAGPPALAYGAYQTITGGLRVYRGATQAYDVYQRPIVHESPLHQAEDFAFGVLPFGSRIEGVLGGLP